MTQAPILTCDIDAELACAPGFMRLVLTQSYQHANLWSTAAGASADTKHRWASRAVQIKALLDQLPAPANPRDPFDDIPGEPMPEEADAAWRARCAAEDVREAARRVPPGPAPKSAVPVPRYFYHPESDCLMRTDNGSHPGTDGLVEEINAATYESIERRQAGLDEQGLVPGDKPASPTPPPPLGTDIEDFL